MNVTKHPYYRKLTKEIMKYKIKWLYEDPDNSTASTVHSSKMNAIKDARRWFRESMKKGGE